MRNTNDANVETVLNKISITEAKATMMLTVSAPPDIQSSAAPLDDVFLFSIYLMTIFATQMLRRERLDIIA